jgi:hypothetical protein
MTLSMPSADTTLTANYSQQFLARASAGFGGSASVSPSSPDGFYNAGTTVQFVATPWSGYSFSSWSGFAAGTGSVATVTLNAAYTPTANFVAGSAPSAVFRAAVWNFSSLGGAGGVYLTTTGPWTATTSAPWVVFWNGLRTLSGPGSSNIAYIVYPNNTGVLRTATIAVGSSVFTITQQP